MGSCLQSVLWFSKGKVFYKYDLVTQTIIKTISILFSSKYITVAFSILDPYRFLNTDLACHFDTDTDPTFYFDADPDPTFHSLADQHLDRSGSSSK
jgi:hypothetical protein